MRIVSLLPSATELLAAAGLADRIVGRSHECDFPGGLGHLPALTTPRCGYDPAAAAQDPRHAAEVDAAVRAALAPDPQTDQSQADRPQTDPDASIYELDTDKLAELRPDLIVTQDLCPVCAVDLGTVNAAARALAAETGRAPGVVALNPATVEDVFDDLLRVAEAAAAADGDDTPVRTARDALTRLRERFFRAEEHVNAYTEGPVVGFLEWTDPPFIAGHWTVELIERAGGRHPLNPLGPPKAADGAALGPQRGARRAGKSIAVPPEAFAAASPEVVVVAPCGLGLEDAERETRRLLERPWFAGTPAARAGRVVAVDGNQMFNRPGPRLVDAFEFLVGLLNDRPGLIPHGFPWLRVD